MLNTTIRRGIGALLLGGAAVGLISLATAGIADAAPANPSIPVIPPGNRVLVQHWNPGIYGEINPQPLPPRQWSPGIFADEINPQPLPPGPPDPALQFWRVQSRF
jgi:hypothetical protein